MERTIAAQIEPGTARIAKSLTGDAVAVLVIVLLLPLAMHIAGIAGYARLLYPATNFGLALYLYVRKSPWYPAHCLLIFCCVSLVRRLVDDQIGFEASNPVLLTPYLCCALTAVTFLEYWSRRQPRGLVPFLVLFGCIGYGTVLAWADDRILSSLVDVLKWSVGPLFAVYLLAHRDSVPQIRSIVEPTLIFAGTGMALYGIAQYFGPTHWDAAWMVGVRDLGFDSVGRPEPFAVRVFGTMNSPGSFGTILSAAIVLALKRRMLVCLSTVAPMLIALALCQYRSLWVMTALAILMVVISPSTQIKRVNVAALLIAALALGSSVLSPQIRDAVVARASSLTELEGDYSGEQRLLQYKEFFNHDGLVVGEGLAIAGASRRLDNKETGVIDGAVIEVYRAMGVFVGTAFMVSIAVLIAMMFGKAAGQDPNLHFDRAIVITLFLQFPIGTVHIGELGFCAWMFMGMALAARFAAQEQR
jgi:hypothetical protein